AVTSVSNIEAPGFQTFQELAVVVAVALRQDVRTGVAIQNDVVHVRWCVELDAGVKASAGSGCKALNSALLILHSTGCRGGRKLYQGQHSGNNQRCRYQVQVPIRGWRIKSLPYDKCDNSDKG